MRTGPTLLFVGPSLAASALPLPAGIERRPPARCGDLLRVLDERPRAIGLVDGLFETSPSVWHKEILGVMAAGVPVLGAASLGALRAAELHMFGMIGIGAIFAAYRDGIQERDDAVMIAHAPAELGWRPLSLALVDAEATIGAAALHDEEKRRLARAAGAIDFRDRTWPLILADASPATRAAIDAAAFSLKQRDAEALAEALARDWPAPAPPPFPRTPYLAALERRIASEAEAGGVEPAHQHRPVALAV